MFIKVSVYLLASFEREQKVPFFFFTVIEGYQIKVTGNEFIPARRLESRNIWVSMLSYTQKVFVENDLRPSLSKG